MRLIPGRNEREGRTLRRPKVAGRKEKWLVISMEKKIQ